MQWCFSASGDALILLSRKIQLKRDTAKTSMTPTPHADRMTRPPFERMRYIHAKIVAGKFPNCTSVAKELEVSTKTIQRDFDYMRDRLNLPLEYDNLRKGFYYTQKVESLPTVQMSNDEWASLLVARQAIAQYQGSPWTPQMDEIIRKISTHLDELISASGINSAISFRAAGKVDVDTDTFRKICDSVIQRREIHFRYRKYSTLRPDHRRVHPYHLSCVNGGWYLVGRNLDRGLIRVYGLERIYALQVTTTRFEPPQNFSASDYFGRTFGIIAEEGMMEVRLRFRGQAAWKVQQRLWHPTQTIIPVSLDEIEMRFDVSSVREVVGWVLGWGEQVTALRPRELVEQVALQARLVGNLYPDAGKNTS